MNHFILATTILGLIADIIAISSILVTIKTPGVSVELIFSSIEINKWHIFSIWCFGFFTYLGLLYILWERDREKKGYNENFWLFLKTDLLVDFSSPFLLLPLLALIALLFGILQSEAIFVLFFLGVAFAAWISFLAENAPQSDFSRETRKKIKLNWDKLENSINGELQTRLWIDTGRLTNFSAEFNLPIEEMAYALILFSIKYPEKAIFGDLFRVQKSKAGLNEGELFIEDVLVSLKNLNQENFFVN